MESKFIGELEAITFGGDNSGASIAITAAIHGNEQTGVRTARLIAKQLENEHILGKVTIFPVCNPTAFRARQRPSPNDNEDLNRIFPGDANGTYSHQLANEIWRATEGYDYIIDLHCCGIYGSLYTMCWYSKFEFQKELCNQLGIETVIHTKGTGGQFYLESCGKRGQKSLLIEMPGGQPGGVVHESIAQDVCTKIINYLKIAGIIAGGGTMPSPVNLCGCIGGIDGKLECIAPHDGFYSRAATAGQFAKKGDVIAMLDGKPIFAQFDALIMSVGIERYVFKGDHLLNLAGPTELPFGTIK